MEDVIKFDCNLYLSWGEKIGAEKIILGAKNAAKHICITNVGHRKVINFHFTRENRKGNPNYLIELSYFTIARIFIELQKKAESFIVENSIFKIINTQIANSDNIVFLPHDEQKDSILSSTFFKERKKGISTKSELEIEKIESFFVSPEELEFNEANFFLVYKVHEKKLVFLGGIRKIDFETNEYLYVQKEKSEILGNFFREQAIQILLKYEFRYKQFFIRYLRLCQNHPNSITLISGNTPTLPG